jgi:hypothetical protein
MKIYNMVLYFVYRIYRWSERGEPDAPMLGVVFITGSFNALALFSLFGLIYIFTKHDPLAFITFFPSKWHFAPVSLGWYILHYIVLEKTGIKRQALKKYSKQKIKNGGVYVVIAIAADVILLIVSAYFYMEIKFPK